MLRGANDMGDPTVLGWTICLLYLMAGLLSFRTAIIRRARDSAASFFIWGCIITSMYALGLNKQLDAQTVLIRTAKHIAKQQNLFKYHRVVHVAFFAVVALCFGVAVFRWFPRIKQFGRAFPLALTGYTLIALYVLSRAFHINHVDRLIGLNLKESSGLAMLEVTGTLLIIIQTIRVIRLQPACRCDQGGTT
jgi:hypothetical protein